MNREKEEKRENRKKRKGEQRRGGECGRMIGKRGNVWNTPLYCVNMSL